MVYRSLPTSFRYLTLATWFWASVCHGQDRWDTISLKTAKIGGVQIYGVSVNSGYSTFSGPINTLDQVVPAGVNVGSDTTYGAQWSLGWRHEVGKLSTSIVYSGGYNGQAHYANLNSFGHSLNMDFSRRLLTKWTVNLMATGDYRTLAQYVFQPEPTSVLAQLPGSASDLAAAFAVGSFSDTQAASTLTGSQLVATASTAARSLLLADRVLLYQMQVSATYAYSSRLNFSFSSFTAGGQHSFDSHTAALPRTIGERAGVTMSYSLSPRTNIGVAIDESHTKNQFQHAYITSANAFFGRNMGRHWFLTMNAGMSYSKATSQGYGVPPSRQAIGGGNFGYRAKAHTFLASYNRSSFDTYGIAAGTNSMASGAWNWHRPGSGWTLLANFGQSQIRNAGFTSLSGWHGNTGISRTLTNQFSVNCEYAYLYSTGSYLGVYTQRTVQSMRLSFRWQPLGIPHQEQIPDLPDNDHW